MNREIKFRGKPANKVDGVFKSDWYYGLLIPTSTISQNESYAICGSRISESSECELYEVITETIGQFTGLYDKNGNEIYEGDIVEFYDTKSYCINPDCEPHIRGYGTCIYKRVCEVKFVNGVFGVESHNVFLDSEVLAWCGLHTEELEDMKEMEENDAYFDTNGYNIDDSIVGIKVIGNIYDNPELLK